MRRSVIALFGMIVCLGLTTACNSVASFLVEDTVQSAMESTMTNGQTQSKTKRDKANDKEAERLMKEGKCPGFHPGSQRKGREKTDERG